MAMTKEALFFAVRAEASIGRVCVYRDNNGDIVVTENVNPAPEADGDGWQTWSDIKTAMRAIERLAGDAGVAVYHVRTGTEERRERSSYDPAAIGLIRIPVAAASEDLKRICTNGYPRPKRPAAEGEGQDEAPAAKRPASDDEAESPPGE